MAILQVCSLYDCVRVPVGSSHVEIGDIKKLPVLTIGRLNLRNHQTGKPDFDAKLTNIYVVDGMGYNLFSLQDLQERHEITLDFEGIHVFDWRQTFPRNERSLSMFATRPPSSLGIPPVTTIADVPSDQFPNLSTHSQVFAPPKAV